MAVRLKYGLQWSDDWDDARIEMQFVRSNGFIEVAGSKYGEGLFAHFKALQIVLWRDNDHHRWSDLILSEILANRVTVLAGSRDCGKTHCMAEYALTDYFCYPNETLTLMSSTHGQGLQLRVWGEVKDLFLRAKEAYPWLPGNIVESRYGIFTDALGPGATIRDMRKGIICVACAKGDEESIDTLMKFCFSGTAMVDTPNGQTQIRDLRPGDKVLNAIGVSTIRRTVSHYAPKLLRVRLSSGAVFECTPDHPLLCESGWINAVDVFPQCRLISVDESLQIVQQGICVKGQAANFLQSVLCSEMEMDPALNSSEYFGSYRRRGTRTPNLEVPSTQYPGARQTAPANEEALASVSKATSSELRIRFWQYSTSGKSPPGTISRGNSQFQSENRSWVEAASSPHISSRLSLERYPFGRRDRRLHTSLRGTAEQRQNPRHVFEEIRVVSVEILERGSSEGYDPSKGAYRVYNLEVEGHPSYSVEGCLVHNCGAKQKRRRLLGDEIHAMPGGYLNVFSNLDKGDFKGVFGGNPIGSGDPLDRLSEPVKGWSSLPEPTKTTVWENKLGGHTINLVGTDSPNFDAPKGGPYPYPYLIDPDDETRTLQRYGADSMQYWSQIKGVRKPGLLAHRILTIDICQKKGAFEKCLWESNVTTKVYSLDAAFGGDRPIAGVIEFGREVGGRTVIKCHPPRSIPITIGLGLTPEEQLAKAMRDDCLALGVPPENVFYDAGMRATLAVEIGRIFSTRCNAINFGGTATTRPVSSDDFLFDEKTRTRRLKRADEAYSKFVTEINWSVRMVVDAGQMREIPEDVVREFEMREWYTVSGNRYELETKAETKKRMGYSPDLADWLAIGVEGSRRLGFQIEGIREVNEETNQDSEWLSKELAKFKTYVKKNSLNYS